MKVLVLTLLMVAVAFAIPVELDSDDESQLTLTDIENEQSADVAAPESARSKRFILKKLALVKAGALGLGALGLAGAVAAKSGGGFGGNRISQGYGPSYGYGSGTTSYPSTYYTSQTYVPAQPQYIPQQQVYGPPAPPSFGGPINSALAWKAGIANNLVSGISGIASSATSGFSAAHPGYSYGAPPPPAPPAPIGPIAPLPNKPVYVVCDTHN